MANLDKAFFFFKRVKFTHEPFLLILRDADSQGEADSRGAACDEDHLLDHCAWSAFVLQLQQQRMKANKTDVEVEVTGNVEALLKPAP